MKFITPIIFIIVSAGIVYWYVFPQYGQIQSLQAQSAQYATASTEAQAAIAKQATLETEYQNLSAAEIQRLDEVLPASADDIGAAKGIADIASRYNVPIQNITVSDNGGTSANSSGGSSNAPASPYGTITLQFSVAMPYQTFLQFLQSIESSLHLTDVTAIQFSASAAEPYTYSVTLANYWLN